MCGGEFEQSNTWKQDSVMKEPYMLHMLWSWLRYPGLHMLQSHHKMYENEYDVFTHSCLHILVYTFLSPTCSRISYTWCVHARKHTHTHTLMWPLPGCVP
jgi:hypothetical protein